MHTWEPAVGAEVIVHPNTDHAVPGLIVEDFGKFEPHPVDANDVRIAEPARRWAVLTDTGHLIFADTCHLEHTPAANNPD